MHNRLRNSTRRYPGQFWLMFAGMLLSTIGTSMIWPFLLLYASKRLELPLTQVATLLTINAGAGLVSSMIAGPLTDKLGRKWLMTFSLFTNGLVYLLMVQAGTYLQFAGLMLLSGTVNPLYRVGADAMLADLIEPDERPDAYALMRMSNNVGISIGPAIGGFLATTSYALAFYGAAIGLGVYSLLLAFFAHETLPVTASGGRNTLAYFLGYVTVLKDRRFIPVIAIVAFGWITAGTMWILLPVYTNQQFGLPESQYGLMPATNALMVVLFQILVTRITKRYRPMPMMALGMFFYAIGTGSVALGSGFWHFWLSMVVMTIGELIIVPTSSTYVANVAPPDMRGRYMSIYGLTWNFGSGIGPLLGGFLSDTFGPPTIWIGSLAIGLVSTLGLVVLSSKTPDSRELSQP